MNIAHSALDTRDHNAHALETTDFGYFPVRGAVSDAGEAGSVARFLCPGAWASRDVTGTVACLGLHRGDGCRRSQRRETRRQHRAGTCLSDGYHFGAAPRDVLDPMAVADSLLGIGGRRGWTGGPHRVAALHRGHYLFRARLSEISYLRLSLIHI